MKASEKKREVGYADLKIVECCGTCMNCVERGKHLRCGKHGFAVSKLGICRNGYVNSQGTRQRGFQLPARLEESVDRSEEPKLLEYNPNAGEALGNLYCGAVEEGKVVLV